MTNARTTSHTATADEIRDTFDNLSDKARTRMERSAVAKLADFGVESDTAAVASRLARIVAGRIAGANITTGVFTFCTAEDVLAAIGDEINAWAAEVAR